METMTLERMSYIAEIIGVIAVVFTLIFLTIQVRQNTRQIKSQGLQSAAAQYISRFDHATSTSENAEIFRRGLNIFDGLSKTEQAYLHSLIHLCYQV